MSDDKTRFWRPTDPSVIADVDPSDRTILTTHDRIPEVRIRRHETARVLAGGLAMVLLGSIGFLVLRSWQIATQDCPLTGRTGRACIEPSALYLNGQFVVALVGAGLGLALAGLYTQFAVTGFMARHSRRTGVAFTAVLLVWLGWFALTSWLN